MNEFKKTRLDKQDKDDLFNTFNSIKKNIDEEFHKKIKFNYDKSYNLTCEAQNAARPLEDLKKGVDILKKYQTEAKKYMLPKKEMEEIYKRFSETWNILNKRKKENQDSWEKESKANYKKIRTELDKVKNNLNKYSNLKELSQTLKNQQAAMKGKKFKIEDRNELYNDINDYFSKIFKIRE